MKTFNLMSVLATAMVILFSSCSKEDSPVTTPDPIKAFTTPQDTITNFYVFFSDPIDSAAEVGAIEDPDGPGPKESSISGVALKANTHYVVTFAMEDATNPEKTINIQNKIKTAGKEYKICVSNPLDITVKAIDSDGLLPIGLVNDLHTTSTTGNSTINFSVKYQKDVKNGDCAPGILIYNCSIPVTVYNP